MPNKLSVDTLRGLACLLLVSYHVIGFSPDAGLRLPTDHAAAAANDWLAILRMPLFTFLSGLVYALRPAQGRYADVVRSKVRRLLVPLLTVGTGFALLQTMTPGTNNDGVDLRFIHVVPVAHYWFLEALFWIFMLVMVLDRHQWLSRPGRLAAVGAVATVVQLAAPLPIHFGLEGATTLLPYFLLGIAAVRFHDALSGTAVTAVSALVLAAIAASWMVAAPQRLASTQTLDQTVASVCCCLVLLRLRPEVRWLAWVGRWSFGIYLFHAAFTAAARMKLKQLGVENLGLLFAIGLSAGLLGPILLTYVLRRVPYGHLLLGEKPRPTADAAGLTTAWRG